MKSSTGWGFLIVDSETWLSFTTRSCSGALVCRLKWRWCTIICRYAGNCGACKCAHTPWLGVVLHGLQPCLHQVQGLEEQRGARATERTAHEGFEGRVSLTVGRKRGERRAAEAEGRMNHMVKGGESKTTAEQQPEEPSTELSAPRSQRSQITRMDTCAQTHTARCCSDTRATSAAAYGEL